jgi:hypothetical protein
MLSHVCNETGIGGSLDSVKAHELVQLKKFRKKQLDLGTVGSKFGAICSVSLKPATAILIKGR